MTNFEQWFADQDFYINMRFIHGDALFCKDGDVYRVLPVQMTWVAWGKKPKLGKPFDFDLLEAKQTEIGEKDKRIVELEQFNQNQYLGMKDRALEIEKLTELIHKLLEDDHTYMRPSMAHECIVATGWKCEPK